jgi:hypothetical protein
VVYYERRLPHWHPDGRDLFITWRLHGTIPRNRYFPPQGLTAGQAFVWMDRFLDKAQYGASWLRKPEIANMIVDALHFGEFDRKDYALHAYVVMPNHVHVLIAPAVPVPKLMQSIKGFTARTANALLDRTGPFWQHESYDHWVRDGEFSKIKRYIEMNPVNAGLALEPELYPWSSAAKGSSRLESRLAASTGGPTSAANT